MVDPGGEAEAERPPPLAPASVRGKPEDPACLGRLRALGVAFTEIAPLGEGECFVPHPIQVSSVGSGVTVAPAATMNCPTAEALARWTKDVLAPRSKSMLDATPTQLLPGSTYACRPRNNQAGAKLSEHAIANAFDLMGVAFAEREPIEIAASDGSVEGRFQDTLRKESCAYFTTVLGPGSDAAHSNHFHFDLAERGGDYRLCDLGEPVTAVSASPNSDRE
jgi:hypothetical protein